MLLRVGVANHKSIRDYSEVSLVAAKAIKDEGPALLPTNGGRQDALPVLLLYGANASGKSAMHDAIRMMREHVVKSFSRAPDAPIPQHAFALGDDSANGDTHFDCDMIVDGVRYHYGFEFDRQRFKREWLYQFPDGHRRLLFNRDVANDGVDFGKSLKGRNRVIEDLMRPNSLFLSVAAQSAHPQLTPVFAWFASQVRIIGTGFDHAEIQRMVGDEPDPRMVDFLRHADTGIADVRVVREKPPEEIQKFLERFQQAVVPSDTVEFEFKPLQDQVKLSFGHIGTGDAPVFLPFASESRGTKRLVGLMTRVYAALDTGSVLVIDEMDLSLHSYLSVEVIRLFSSADTNPHGAQLIATTHDTHLLCSDVVRRDQIWFVEKSAGASHFYPLTDIRTRNTDNLQRGYLQGRFGAVPFVGGAKRLFVDAETPDGAA